jgi:acetate kinase
MPYRMIAATFLLVALDLATVNSARAQGVADIDNAMRAVEMRIRGLNTARKSLQQMEYHHDDHEADAARDITDADTIVFTAAVKVFTVAFIAKSVKCPEDFRFTQKQFGLVAESLVTTADEELTLVNDKLRIIAAPAALAEATNIRDLIVDLRDFLKPFAAKE